MTLRTRIKERMPKILEVLRPEDKVSGFGIEGDIRPSIISDIKIIEAFTPEPPSVVRDKHTAVAKAAKRLRLAIRGMREYAALDAPLERCVKDSERVADAVAPEGRLNRSGGATSNTQQNLLAARCAYDLLLDNGFGVPTLTEDDQYVQLTALLIETATGRPCSATTASRACKQLFEVLLAERGVSVSLSESEQAAELEQDPWPYSQSNRRPRVVSSSGRDERTDEVSAWSEAHRRRHLEASRHYPPLEQLLDDML